MFCNLLKSQIILIKSQSQMHPNGLFGCVFKESKSAFNTQKVCLKKKKVLI
jgi:hypothetical protein